MRLRLVRGFSGLDIDGRQYELPDRLEMEEQARIETWSPNELFRDATQLLLIGDGYEFPHQAHVVSAHWRGQLQLILAYADIGADFGERQNRQVSDGGRTHWNEMPLDGVVNLAQHGLVIYPTERGPGRWMHAEWGSVTGVAFAPDTRVFEIVSAEHMELNEQGQVA